jgi:hypothetical protein
MPRGDWQRPDARRTVESVLDLDIRPLARGWLPDLGPRHVSVTWTRGPWRNSVTVALVNGTDGLVMYSAEGQPVTERVRLDSTPCQYGGERFWWLCPSCNRRSALLYLRSERFECRSCSKLTYTTSQASRWTRSARKSVELGRRIGVQVGTGYAVKPRGMHWRTFWRLHAEYHAASLAACDDLSRWIDSARGPSG